MYIPNLDNDGHDTGMKFSGDWLRKFLTPILADSEGLKDTLVVVTFDESATYPPYPNHVFTLLMGPMVKAGARSDTAYNHYDLLRTAEDNFGLGTLGKNDQKAKNILATLP